MSGSRRPAGAAPRRAVCLALLWLAGRPLAAADAPAPPPDEPGPHQRVDTAAPPAAPDATPVDPGAPLPPLPPPPAALPQVERVPAGVEPADGPGAFNPDPGATLRRPAPAPEPFFRTFPAPIPADPADAPLTPAERTPRGALERPQLAPVPPAAPPRYGRDPVPAGLELPRLGVRENLFIPNSWRAGDHAPASAADALPPHAEAVPDRWTIGFAPWRRYTAGDTDELPYYRPRPARWHYYRQSVLKGDLPIRDQDLFLSLTAESETVFEDRKLTVPSGVSAARAGSFDFYGRSRSQSFESNFSFEADLFRGDTVFKPVEWLVHLKPVFNFNYVGFQETGLVSPDPRGALGGGGTTPDNGGVTNPGDIDGLLLGGTTPVPASYVGSRHTARNKTYASLQEAFVERHLGDLSANYDFWAVKVGNQTFNSDFRGFIFNDTNLGARVFGSYDDNRWQYNAALFDLREKDTNSGLNTFDRRGQVVAIANVYRQDFLVHGYTAQLSLHASFDQSGTHYDTNGDIVRPAPIGTVEAHRVDSYYLGWTGDGHLGRWNVTHALYGVTGRDDLNGIAGRPVEILAGMAALEVSYDRDWIRYEASAFYATGDHHAEDGRATGFDSIADNTNFTGGPFSYFVRQGFNLGGTAVGLKQRFSLLPDLRTSKSEGQANFVNPGLVLYGVGAEADLTPKLRAFANANWLQFESADVIKRVLITNQAHREFGADLSAGVQWRPFLIDNVIVSAGCGVLLPGRGFRDIFRVTEPAVPGFTPVTGPGVDRFLYSAVAALTLTY